MLPRFAKIWAHSRFWASALAAGTERHQRKNAASPTVMEASMKPAGTTTSWPRVAWCLTKPMRLASSKAFYFCPKLLPWSCPNFQPINNSWPERSSLAADVA